MHWSKRDIVIFFAGIQTFHTLSHIAINYLGILPIELVINWTQQLNVLAIGINAIITLWLFWWASKLK